MRSPAIDKETVSNMLRLREEGYTNAEIAAQFDLSPATVLHHIGRQPFRKPRSERCAIPAKPELSRCNLNIDRRIVTLSGVFLSFEMDTEDDTCLIRLKSDDNGDVKFRATVPRALLEALGNEILEAAKF